MPEQPAAAVDGKAAVNTVDTSLMCTRCIVHIGCKTQHPGKQDLLEASQR